jgi:hypothetical protein
MVNLNALKKELNATLKKASIVETFEKLGEQISHSRFCVKNLLLIFSAAAEWEKANREDLEEEMPWNRISWPEAFDILQEEANRLLAQVDIILTVVNELPYRPGGKGKVAANYEMVRETVSKLLSSIPFFRQAALLTKHNDTETEEGDTEMDWARGFSILLDLEASIQQMKKKAWGEAMLDILGVRPDGTLGGYDPASPVVEAK